MIDAINPSDNLSPWMGMTAGLWPDIAAYAPASGEDALSPTGIKKIAETAPILDAPLRDAKRVEISPSLGTGWKRTAEMAAIFMIGDGMLGLFQPRRHVNLWRSGVNGLDTLVRPFADRPRNRRIYGLAQIAVGLALASRLSTRVRDC